MLEVVAVPALTDNYIWLVRDEDSGETAVVDPGDAAPALEEAERRGWPITQVWNTHWHPDHTGGNLAIKAATGAPVSGPAAETIAGRDVALSEGSALRIGGHIGRVIEIPGHTLGHVALVFEDDRIAFVGDTLFAMGCGRLFEGTAEQMFALAPADRGPCAGHRALLRPRIYARQRPVRGHRRTRQRRRSASGSKRSASCAKRDESPFRQA